MNQYQRYKTEPSTQIQQKNYRNQLKKDNRCQSLDFNLKAEKLENTPIIHKKSKTKLKKYVFAQNKI